jgi:hypothetical protein
MMPPLHYQYLCVLLCASYISADASAVEKYTIVGFKVSPLQHQAHTWQAYRAPYLRHTAPISRGEAGREDHAHI